MVPSADAKGVRSLDARRRQAEGRGKAAAAVGFTVKSGWCCAVLLTGSTAEPRLLDCRRVELSDPAIPESRQPYHAGFGTARHAGRELTRLLASVRRFGRKSVTGLLRAYETAEHHLCGAGVVVGSLIDPERIANDHIRIHALEGRLFREVVALAATRERVPCSIWRDRDLYPVAAEALGLPERSVRDRLAVLGRDVSGPWRVEQKTAALAAWTVMSRLRS